MNTLPYSNNANEFFAFSEFWYSMEDVLKMGGPYIPGRLQKAARVSDYRVLLSGLGLYFVTFDLTP